MEKKQKPVIVFDVNETLLDMAPLKERINSILDHPEGFRIWFGLLLQYSLVSVEIDQYQNFSELANATLQMAAESIGKVVDKETLKSALTLISQLKAYPDVEPGLKKLKAAGFKLVTLTNSPQNVQVEQLAFAGIADYFEQQFSIDAIKTYKPSLNTYKWVAAQLSVNIKEMIMVAAHGWDIAGAASAGLSTAFIARKEQTLYPLVQQPDINETDLIKIARAIQHKYA